MNAFQSNPSFEARDSLIFGTPLDWQSAAIQHQRVRFCRLAAFQLTALLRAGFLEAEASPLNPIAPQDLLAFAHFCLDAGLHCEFEGTVSPPDQQQAVVIARIHIKGAVTPQIRIAFWQMFQAVDIMEISWFELRATWGEEWLYHRLITLGLGIDTD